MVVVVMPQAQQVVPMAVVVMVMRIHDTAQASGSFLSKRTKKLLSIGA
jgi:hypothetical protein